MKGEFASYSNDDAGCCALGSTAGYTCRIKFPPETIPAQTVTTGNGICKRGNCYGDCYKT